MKFRDEKVTSNLKNLTAEFVAREAGVQSLITVTNLVYSERNNIATVFISVLPEAKEASALDFLKRKKYELYEYVRDHLRIRAIPRFDFEIDTGEKNRQKIDEISNQI